MSTLPELNPTVVWEHQGIGEVCQMDPACINPARWVVQDHYSIGLPRFPGQAPRHRFACEAHRPAVTQ
jgi:hypothetical protein